MQSDAETNRSCAAWIARVLRARGIDRIFGLQGGHIQPIWDYAAQLGIRIIDVRDEGAAVHMAHAHAELTGGFGVAMVTAGPGVTNTVTAIANASLARMPLLVIGGCPPRPQVNMGPLQDIPHVDILRPVTRAARTARVADQVIRELDEAVARAMGDGGEPGPVYIEIPTDVLRIDVLPVMVLDEWMRMPSARVSLPPPYLARAAAEAIFSAHRPLVIAGRGARDLGPSLPRFLEATGAVYLDTQESRGLLPPEHPAFLGAVRAAAMAQADLIVVIGRKLDYQLAYGSPAVFRARFVRIADSASELIDNRRGDPELLCTPRCALDAILSEASGMTPTADRDWSAGLRRKHAERVAAASLLPPATGPDGLIHPARIFSAIAAVAAPDAIGIADGGDILSFARIGLQTKTYLDSGTFGCLGVGVPYANAASLAFPDRQVIAVIGDGSFGFNAMEIDTAVRHGARPVFIIANNAAWNIERYDQETNYGGRIVGTTLRHSDYAALARALGAHGARVERTEDLPAALERALANAPAVLDVVVSQQVASSDGNKGLGFVPDFQALTAWDDAEKARRQQ